ncbi:hypothetical protein N7509_005928 [Penicillium cosmopolitanum]|uniref:Uncharacterized protein n=1 Tax=Penicillium cosmopolitanum TaxID=1131564 RepID=A0A9X0BAI8_9EURO|nr:uncharacterized protein N7509_005928 [Penicillium cosmopolitanum]KAJ5397815.1 hypothetical protein N7509_005928 [Penicillium cosmopolitanum]
MDAQPLTNLQSESESNNTNTPYTPLDSAGSPPADTRQTPGSWSIRRFLSRRSSRRYRVLEREPNRLRKRVSQ